MNAPEMIGVENLIERVPEERSRAFEQIWSQPTGFIGFFRTIDNIPIGIRYMAAAFLLFLVAGGLALLMRLQLSTPERQTLDAETYNQLFTMHGTTMMFLFVIPFIEAVATYMLPLILGTRDLPFPRLTAFSYWTYTFGVLFLFSSFLFGVAPDAGWFAYPPLTLKEHSQGLNMDFWDIGLSVAEIAALGAAAEIIISILRMRAPGMSLHRIPIFAWAMLITAVMIIFAFTPLIVGTFFLELDRKGVTHFFDPQAGGKPLLWQHIFWVFGHPEVYIMFLPAAGIISTVIPVFSRRPLVSYALVVLSLLAIGFLSFGLWVHHMFATGLPATALGFFAAASMMIAIPNGVQFFSWVATIWTGNPQWRTSMLFAIGFLFNFLIGGLTGVMVGAVPFDWQVHDSYFVVAHFHYVLIGGVIFPFFAGLYYWLPKISGRLMSERLGKWNFWLMFIFFNVAFFPMHISGLLGMPRRIYTYATGLGWDVYNLTSTVGAWGFGFAILLGVINFLWSLKRGPAAGHDPWRGDSLEWSHASPPPNAQFKYLPQVHARHPMWEQKTLEPQDEELARILEPVQAGPTTWRGGLVVSVMDAKPIAVVHMPNRSIFPFVEAVAFALIFAGLLVETPWLLVPGIIVAIIGVAGWFRPTVTEDNALAEIACDRTDDRLYLAVYGPASNGWWGTWVFITIWATALFTTIAAYFYLGGGAPEMPPPVPNTLLGVLALATAALSVPAIWLFSRQVAATTAGARRTGIGLTAVLNIAVIVLTVLSLTQSRVTTDTAGGSIVVFLMGWQWLTSGIVLAMLIAAALWAWFRPSDPRGWSVALNTSLVAYFAVANWLIIFVILYLSPALWG